MQRENEFSKRTYSYGLHLCKQSYENLISEFFPLVNTRLFYFTGFVLIVSHFFPSPFRLFSANLTT